MPGNRHKAKITKFRQANLPTFVSIAQFTGNLNRGNSFIISKNG